MVRVNPLAHTNVDVGVSGGPTRNTKQEMSLNIQKVNIIILYWTLLTVFGNPLFLYAQHDLHINNNDSIFISKVLNGYSNKIDSILTQNFRRDFAGLTIWLNKCYETTLFDDVIDINAARFIPRANEIESRYKCEYILFGVLLFSSRRTAECARSMLPDFEDTALIDQGKRFNFFYMYGESDCWFLVDNKLIFINSPFFGLDSPEFFEFRKYIIDNYINE